MGEGLRSKPLEFVWRAPGGLDLDIRETVFAGMRDFNTYGGVGDGGKVFDPFCGPSAIKICTTRRGVLLVNVEPFREK